MNALAFLVVPLAWILILSFRQTRTLRTVLFLAALTVVYATTYVVPGSWSLAIRVSSVTLAAVVIVFFPWPIWYMTRADQEYDELISNSAARLRRLDKADPAKPDVREGRLRDLNDMVEILEGRAPPHIAWERVRDRFLEHLRLDLDLIEGRAIGGRAAIDQTASWVEMRVAWSRARDMRSSFWR